MDDPYGAMEGNDREMEHRLSLKNISRISSTKSLKNGNGKKSLLEKKLFASDMKLSNGKKKEENRF